MRLFLLSVGLLALCAGIPALAQEGFSGLDSLRTATFSLEGGGAFFDANAAHAFAEESPAGTDNVFVDLSDGFYGRADGEITRGANGIGAYLFGWQGDEETTHSSDTNSYHLTFNDPNNAFVVTATGCTVPLNCLTTATSEVDRSLIEGGLRLFHALGGEGSAIRLGLQPFAAFIQEDTDSSASNPSDPLVDATRASSLEALAGGGLLTLDGRVNLTRMTHVHIGVGGGGYFLHADADTEIVNPNFRVPLIATSDHSAETAGFRGQAELGIDQDVGRAMSIGLLGRMDWWSDYPTFQFPPLVGGTLEENNRIATDDYLSFFVGSRLSVKFSEH